MTASASGALFGIGTGPGDPELLTIKAARLLKSCDVIAHFAKRGNVGNARRCVDSYLPADIVELPLLYPVTTELDKDSDAYINAINAFFDASADTLRAHLETGRRVGVLSEGDPLFYGSYMHLHVRLARDFDTTVIPGITAMSGCWSTAGLPIIQGDDCLCVLPGTLGQDELSERLATNEAAVIMKVGRNLGKIRRALIDTGKYEHAVYVERGTMSNGLHMPLTQKQGDAAPYFSLILVPGWSARRDTAVGATAPGQATSSYRPPATPGANTTPAGNAAPAPSPSIDIDIHTDIHLDSDRSTKA